MMKLSTRARYGLRALLDLALHQGEGLVPLKDIARRQEISLPYLEQLITPLIAAGLVRSTRGSRGGVALARLPSEIRLSEVVRVLEGSVAPVECVNDPGLCHRSADCVSRDVWKGMMEAMVQVLESVTLQDLTERPKGTRQAAMEMYYI
ncbi:MAG: Rrf2 family transcriptional regulator [Dehalococcoidia bacterium]|nr:Rrf2 family transcriptional regulator [Dehalococcoidia bacterium]